MTQVSVRIASIVVLASAVTACSAAPDESAAAKPRPGSAGGALNLTAATATATAAAAAKRDYLASYVRPETVLHSFHAAEGIWIDCVDIHRQPSMLTPRMAGKAIDVPPPLPQQPSLPSGHQWAHLDVEDHETELDEAGNVRHCDPGTVPLRRTTEADLAPFATLDDFFAKGPDRAALGAAFSRSLGVGDGPISGSPPSVVGYEYATGGQTVANWGLQAFINVWNPYLEVSGDHSVSQLWVADYTGSSVQTAEAGWIVGAPFDTRTRLFTYWTDDNYHSTGCYNATCAGFVQTNNSVPLGASFSTVSSLGGTQYEMELSWEKSSATSNWWLLWQGTTWLGYLPASLYTQGMQTQANSTQYGGEVLDTYPSGRHTLTRMGSGQPASSWWQFASYQRHVQYIDLTYHTIDPTMVSTVNNPGCYSWENGYDGSGDGWGAFEFFGGSGYNGNTCL